MYHKIVILVKEMLEKIELVGGGQNRFMIMAHVMFSVVVLVIVTMLIGAMAELAQLYLTCLLYTSRCV